MTAVMTAWTLYLTVIITFGVLQFDFRGPPEYFSSRVVHALAHAFEGVAKILLFPVPRASSQPHGTKTPGEVPQASAVVTTSSTPLLEACDGVEPSGAR